MVSESVDDILGELRVLWEKANNIRKNGVQSGGSVKYHQYTTSSAQQKVAEKENQYVKQPKDCAHLNPRNVCNKKSGDNSTKKKTPFADSDLKSHQETKAFKNNSEQTVDEAEHRMRKRGAQSGRTVKACQYTNFSAQQKVVGKENNYGKDSKDSAHLKEDTVFGEPLFQNTKSETRVSDDLAENQCKDNVAPVSKGSFGNSRGRNEDETKAKKAGKQEDEGPLDDEAGDDVYNVRVCLINDREMLKETDEYKRAEEKEWASRQETLRLQAEEAKKMRLLLKRKRAESSRLRDMEIRQKQRVEEIRRTQKKDEEDMNMKEKLRAEVRIGLKQLEMNSWDMASLLRGLGVHVGGDLHPSLHEIRTAYKKALLSFHPDRAPASDIQKLVEAEEKFKLISRMKDKFLPT